jgi:hypothetical protein
MLLAKAQNFQQRNVLLPSAGLMRKLSQKPAEASSKLSAACSLLHNVMAKFLAIIRG